MNNTEAIELLKQDLTYVSQNQTDAYKIAIEAIEKNTPKKPIASGQIEEYDGFHFKSMGCPNCFNIVGEVEQDLNIAVNMKMYCPNCGQAILWKLD